MKRVTFTEFKVPTRVVGRDPELTIALLKALKESYLPKPSLIQRIKDLKHLLP